MTVYINIINEIKKNDYYIKKIGFVNVVINVFIIIVLLVIFVQFYAYNGIQMFNYKMFIVLYVTLFVCFVGILLHKKIKLNKKVLKVARKYGLSMNNKTLKIIYNFS